MENIKRVEKFKINKVYRYPEKSGLSYKNLGKSENINDYSESEINEMILGIYRAKKHLLVDGDYFVNLEDVIKTECTLRDVTYYKKPTIETFKDNSCNIISNIRTFYVKDYFLVTNDPIIGITKHKITRFLFKIGVLKSGRGKYSGLYRISNDHKAIILNVNAPKDLYHPIKKYINDLFFNDDYKISEFELTSPIKILSK